MTMPNNQLYDVTKYFIISLLKDNDIQHVIRQIIKEDSNFDSSHNVNNEEVNNTEQTAEINVTVEVPKDELRTDLSNIFKLLKLVQQDKEINDLWLLNCHNEANALVTLISKTAQWEEIVNLLNCLKDRCKQDKRQITDEERIILESALEIHNRIYDNRKATLIDINEGSPFEFDKYDRGNVSGNIVVSCWLPGLNNAAGEVKFKPVVQTQ